MKNMKPKELRNKKLAQKLTEKLEARHYEVHYSENKVDIINKIKQIIPEKSSISWGGSMTIRDLGITKILKEGDYEIYDRDEVSTEEDKLRIYRKAFECDYYLTSVNAISEDGLIVNIDGNGNRVAAITWGPKRVIMVISLSKVCQDVDAAIKRARSTAAPINMARFNLPHTPCKVDGLCHDCLSADSICNYVSIQRMSHPAHRHIVLLTNEILGY